MVACCVRWPDLKLEVALLALPRLLAPIHIGILVGGICDTRGISVAGVAGDTVLGMGQTQTFLQTL